MGALRKSYVRMSISNGQNRKERWSMSQEVVAVDGDGEVLMEETETIGGDVGQEVEARDTKATRKRKSSNYILERNAVVNGQADEMWQQVKDGFVSPEQAIEHVRKAKLTGRFRAVRVASAEYVSELTTPEPILTVKKIKKQKV